jgi:lipoyl(octanoyl) transferase
VSIRPFTAWRPHRHVLNPGDIPSCRPVAAGDLSRWPGGGLPIDRSEARLLRHHVYRIEEAVIRTLMHFGVTVPGSRRTGIYVRLDDPFSHAVQRSGD